MSYLNLNEEPSSSQFKGPEKHYWYCMEVIHKNCTMRTDSDNFLQNLHLLLFTAAMLMTWNDEYHKWWPNGSHLVDHFIFWVLRSLITIIQSASECTTAEFSNIVSLVSLTGNIYIGPAKNFWFFVLWFAVHFWCLVAITSSTNKALRWVSESENV